MAWGSFCWIPCPYKKWNEDDRLAMLNMFPLVGILLGAVLTAGWIILQLVHAPYILMGALLTALYFHMTGFIHLDGFMDVSDAVMSRRPELEERQRILKDSHVGAFAVICVAFMAMIFAASFIQMSILYTAAACGIITVILVVSRCISAICVISCEPMSTSQYNQMKVTRGSIVPAIIIMILVIAAGAAAYIWLWPNAVLIGADEPDMWIAGPTHSPFVRYVVPVGITIAVSWLVGMADRKRLGGMNGDISGHMITIGETAGVAAMAALMM